ncbi:unnamed protein product, partial [Polarella glacialis]
RVASPFGHFARCLEVHAEVTPNPKTMKFLPEGKDVLGAGTKTYTFRSAEDASESALARKLLEMDGIREVMLAAQHITVTKAALADWDELHEVIQGEISDFYDAGLTVMEASAIETIISKEVEEGSLEARILQLLEERVKPFVQQDGGDVEFERFDYLDGTLYLMMKGSCSGCSQSHATLQEGVRNLMDHYIPEVKHIVGLNDQVEEEIPRPGRY